MPPYAHFFVPAVAAVLAAGLLRLLARWRLALLSAAAPLSLLAGAVALTLPFNLRAVWAPRVMADHLLLVAAAGLLAAAVGARAPRRWLVPFALAFATGWWVAHAPPALPEFWRAGLAVTVYALLLMRSSLPALLAGSLAGAAACVLAGTAAVWQEALLVPAAASAGLLGARVPAGSVAAFVAASASLLSLSGGRAVSGRLTAADGAALVPLLAALLWPFLARRFGGAFKRAAAKPRVAVRRRHT